MIHCFNTSRLGHGRSLQCWYVHPGGALASSTPFGYASVQDYTTAPIITSHYMSNFAYVHILKFSVEFCT